MPGRIGVFLDRDGTLNVEVDYLRSPDQLHVYEGAAKAIRTLNERGIVACVLSNQSGVARGFLTEADLISIHAKLQQVLSADAATLDRIYYCPHHPTAGIDPYNIVCECRKPKPGMLHAAAREFKLDLLRSFVVGDSVVDMQVAHAVGATPILVRTGYGATTLQTCNEQQIAIAFVADSIVEAIDFILKQVEGHDNE